MSSFLYALIPHHTTLEIRIFQVSLSKHNALKKNGRCEISTDFSFYFVVADVILQDLNGYTGCSEKTPNLKCKFILLLNCACSLLKSYKTEDSYRCISHLFGNRPVFLVLVGTKHVRNILFAKKFWTKFRFILVMISIWLCEAIFYVNVRKIYIQVLIYRHRLHSIQYFWFPKFLFRWAFLFWHINTLFNIRQQVRSFFSHA